VSWHGIEVAMVWAQDTAGAIGVKGGIPWYVPEDFARFKELTLGAAVIMGRATWDSLPERSRPLPGRHNIVISRNTLASAPGADVVGSVEQALEHASSFQPEDGAPTIWIIGGGQIYRQALAFADRLEVTVMDTRIAGAGADAFAPVLGDDWAGTQPSVEQDWHTSRTGMRFTFLTYRRVDTGSVDVPAATRADR